jgi:hypothetical protein
LEGANSQDSSKEDFMRTILCGLILLASMTLTAADKLQPLNVKVGLWEMSETVTTSGEMPIPPEVLAKLTPEQRAKLEAQMKSNSGGHTRTITYKSCLTKEQLEKAPSFMEKKNCNMTVLRSSSSQADVQGVCTDRSVTTHLKLHIEALNPENTRMAGEVTVNGDGHTMNSHANFTGKWVGPSCGDTK